MDSITNTLRISQYIRMMLRLNAASLTIRPGTYPMCLSTVFFRSGNHPKKKMKSRTDSLSGTSMNASTETEIYTPRDAFPENSRPVRSTQRDANAGPAMSAKGKMEPRNRNVIARADMIPPNAVLYVFSLIVFSAFRSVLLAAFRMTHC